MFYHPHTTYYYLPLYKIIIIILRLILIINNNTLHLTKHLFLITSNHPFKTKNKISSLFPRSIMTSLRSQLLLPLLQPSSQLVIPAYYSANCSHLYPPSTTHPHLPLPKASQVMQPIAAAPISQRLSS